RARHHGVWPRRACEVASSASARLDAMPSLAPSGLHDEVGHFKRFVTLPHNAMMDRNLLSIDLDNGGAEIPFEQFVASLRSLMDESHFDWQRHESRRQLLPPAT